MTTATKKSLTAARIGSKDEAPEKESGLDILIASGNSFLTFVREMRAVRAPDGTARSEELTYPIRFSKAQGTVVGSAGCSLAVDDAFVGSLRSIAKPRENLSSRPYVRWTDEGVPAETVQEAKKRLLGHLRVNPSYGIKFAFTDDKDNAARITAQIRGELETRASMLAEFEEIVSRSDVTVDEDRVY